MASRVALAVLLALVAVAVADLPVHCLNVQVRTVWGRGARSRSPMDAPSASCCAGLHAQRWLP
jgi:hypothetical protein